MHERPLLSACLIVKNEQRVMKRCLSSLKGVADEVIVVDTGSTDATVQLCLENGAIVHHAEWEHDFAKARNTAIDLATGQWVLVLDADESILEPQGVKLRNLLNAEAQAEGYFVKVINYYGYGHKVLGASVSSSMRLFRNNPQYRYKGKIHEQIVEPILQANPKAALLFTDLEIEHDGYLTEVVRDKGKSRRNIELLEREVEEHGDPFQRYNIAVEYIRAGDYELALKQLRLCKLADRFLQRSYAHIVMKREIDTLDYMGRYEEALVVCDEAARAFADFPDIFLSKGICSYRLGRWEEAETALTRALEIGEAPPQYSSNRGTGSYQATFYMGKLCERTKRYDDAIRWYLFTLRMKPDSLPPFLRIIRLLVRLAERSQWLAKVEELFTIDSARTWWSVALAFYQLGLYEETLKVLGERAMPEEKKAESDWLTIRCLFLLVDEGEKSEFAAQWTAAKGSPVKCVFYASLLSNDASAARASLPLLENAGEDPLTRALYRHLLADDNQLAVDPVLMTHISQQLWSELAFLHHMSRKHGLPMLAARIQTFWQAAIAFAPDPAKKIEGQFAWVRTLHVRIHQLILSAPQSSVSAEMWNETSDYLMPLIDDLFLGETV